MAFDQKGYRPPPPRGSGSAGARPDAPRANANRQQPPPRFADRTQESAPLQVRSAAAPRGTSPQARSAAPRGTVQAPRAAGALRAAGAGGARPQQRPPQGRVPAKRPAVRRAPQRGRRKRPPVLMFLFLALLVAVLGLSAYGASLFFAVRSDGDTFYQGVHVGGMPLGGLTVPEAREKLAQAEAQTLSQWYVDLQYNGQKNTITAQDIGLRLDLDDQIEAAYRVGREGTVMERKQVIDNLKLEPFYTQGGITFDASKLNSILGQIQRSLERAPEDATAAFTPEQESPFTYTDEVHGRHLDIEPIRESIEDYIYALLSGAVELVPETLPPAITRAQLQQNLTCLVVVTTEISYRSEPGRNENIRIACERLNNLVVMPNERVSTNKVFGKRTAANGYQEAPEIAYGEMQTGIGGGVCQVSSTLYQALLRAGIKVEERAAHAIPSNYAEKGQDATVSDRGIDLVFRNNTEYPIYIRAQMTEGTDKARTKRCEVSVYGRALPDGVRYVLETRLIAEEMPIEPPNDKETPDKNQTYVTYTNQTKRVEGRRGYRVKTYVVYKQGDMEIGREETFESYYKPSQTIVYRGVLTRD